MYEAEMTFNVDTNNKSAISMFKVVICNFLWNNCSSQTLSHNSINNRPGGAGAVLQLPLPST